MPQQPKTKWCSLASPAENALSASYTVGEHDYAVLGVKKFKAKLWVDSGSSVANYMYANFVFRDVANRVVT